MSWQKQSKGERVCLDRVCHGREVEVEIGHITATIRKERGMDTCLRLLSTLSLLIYNPGSSQGMAPPTVDRSPHLRELSQENLSQARPEAQCFHTVKCTVNTFSALLFISYGREAVTTEIRCLCRATQLGNAGLAWGSDPTVHLTLSMIISRAPRTSSNQTGEECLPQHCQPFSLGLLVGRSLRRPSVPFLPELVWLRDISLARDAQGWVPTGPPCKLQDNKDLQYLCWPSLPPTHFLPQRKMKESDNYFYLPPNCTNYQPISSQCDRHQLWKTHRDKLALIGFPLAV